MKYAMHIKGLSTGLSVNDALAHQFMQNESRTRKLTDSQIAVWMKTEFEGTDINVDDLEVATRRRQYNSGSGPWAPKGPATLPSKQYDAAGAVVPDTKIVRQTIVQGVTEARVVELINHALPNNQVIIDSVTKKQQELKDQFGSEVADLRRIIENRPNITVVVPGKSDITMPGDSVHKMFRKAMLKIAAGVPLMLVGPSGSGKTHLAKQLAKALGRRFTFNSMSAGVSESSLLGRNLPDATGAFVYRPAPFVESYRDGGVHLLDEMDAADSNLLVQINAAIANGVLSIPFADGLEPIERHPDSVIIAAANTFGNGANRVYVGRNQLDAATLNRFTMSTIVVDYDVELEETLITSAIGADLGGVLLNWAWAIRKKIEENNLRRIMSTRNLIDAAKCLAGGEDMSDIKQDYFAGWSQDEKVKVAA